MNRDFAEAQRAADERKVQLLQWLEALRSLQREPAWKVFQERVAGVELAAYRAALEEPDSFPAAKLLGKAAGYSDSRTWLERELEHVRRELELLTS